MKNLVLGLTGQSGAGKSTLCRYLQHLGCTIVDADEAARTVVEKGSACIADIALEFGCEYLTVEGGLNRRKMAETVFTDKAKLKRLNAVMFPYIINDLKEQLEQARKTRDGIIILDAPTLFESGADKFCDRVASVIAPEEARMERIIARDRLTQEEADHRIHAQHGQEFYTGRSWCVINNDSDEDGLRMQADNMMSRLAYLLEHDQDVDADSEPAEQEEEEE